MLTSMDAKNEIVRLVCHLSNDTPRSCEKKGSEETKQSIRSIDAHFIDVLSELICVLYNFYCRIAVMAFVERFNFR